MAIWVENVKNLSCPFLVRTPGLPPNQDGDRYFKTLARRVLSKSNCFKVDGFIVIFLNDVRKAAMFALVKTAEPFELGFQTVLGAFVKVVVVAGTPEIGCSLDDPVDKTEQET